MKDINILYNILKCDDIANYENTLFELIPELESEKGFEQRSEWHSFDVWTHTLITIKACDMNKEDRLVMLLHDIGKPFSYQDDGDIRHFKGHAKKSAEISKIILNRFNMDKETKNTLLKLIELHSSRINTDDINIDNINFYRRLLKIQICDATGYEKEHANKTIEQLNNMQQILTYDYK